MNEHIPVKIDHLCHKYGKRVIYNDLNLTFYSGKIYGLLGKNGVGKTTLIKILMGFLKPVSGTVQIFGEPANAISPETRRRVGLLFERHLAYDFFSIAQVEKFMSSFYPAWKAERFYALADVLGLKPEHKIANMSEGQRAQIVLGLILAQDPELLILDDYSMGLDAGYRRLFVDFLRENLRDGKHTVILTSHVIQDMDSFVDEAVFLRRGGQVNQAPLQTFLNDFCCYRVDFHALDQQTTEVLKDMGLKKKALPKELLNAETHAGYCDLFGFVSKEQALASLVAEGLNLHENALQAIPMNTEDAFVGYTGRF